MTRFLVIAIFAALVSSPAFAARAQRILHIRTLGDPLSLDWNRVYSPVESILVRNLMEGLVALGGGKSTHGEPAPMKVLPALAASWKISKDGRTYEFFLKPGVKWSDGVPLKAQQFVDSWRRLLAPGFKANYAYLLYDIENAEAFSQGKIADFAQVGVKADGDHKLVVRLRGPVAYWLWIPTFWATFPVRADLIEKQGADWDKAGKMVTLGPFLYAAYEPRRNVVLKRNPSYHGKRGNVDQVVAALVEDEASAVRLYEDNQLDFITRLSVEARRLKARSDLVTWNEARVVHLDFNPNEKPVDDPRLRRAIALAIDKPALASLLEGASRAATSLVPPGILAYDAAAGASVDVKRARELFSAAGYASGTRMKLELVVSAYGDDVLAAGFIAEQLKRNLGIEVVIHKYEAKQFYSPSVTMGGYAMILNRWTADFPDPDNFYSIFLSSSGNNRVGWKDAEYDRQTIEARTLLKPADRVKAYSRLHQRLVDDQAIAIPLYYGRNCALVRPTIKGFEPTPTNSYLFKDFVIR